MSSQRRDEEILVLHVDDEPQFGELVRAYLERLDDGVEVLTASTPSAGLDRLDDEPIDCVVSDYQMPGKDGLEFLEGVREHYPNLPFVLFTGQGSEEIASEAIQAGVDSYLQKNGTEVYELLANQIRNLVGRRRSEHRAKIAQDRLVQLYEQTDGFYTIDENWTVTYWNQRIADRTGLTSDDVVGERFWDVFPGAQETRIQAGFERAMATREEVELEVEFEPHDNWVELRVYPVDDGLFVHSRDITDKKRQESELQYRNEILKSFANTVSHDLRNPLNVAEGKLELAQETEDFEHLEGVARAHNRMRNLIDDLLQVARGDSLELSTVSLREAAETAWGTVSSREAVLTVEGEMTFRAYESQLRRLFENLFWNALDHGKATTVRVGPLADGFYVADDGTGIAPDQREKVFESGFSTADSPGYGLSIVDGIAEIHGWGIDVTGSEAGGARFELTGVKRDDAAA
ncbi:response regulator [Natronomonas sp. EA1]|uniref:sensor histidine kinase n=1 Tax=Natronomonas sp. EA1 TaxID=3421655 RepID=UPI003EBE9878